MTLSSHIICDSISRITGLYSNAIQFSKNAPSDFVPALSRSAFRQRQEVILLRLSARVKPSRKNLLDFSEGTFKLQPITGHRRSWFAASRGCRRRLSRRATGDINAGGRREVPGDLEKFVESSKGAARLLARLLLSCCSSNLTGCFALRELLLYPFVELGLPNKATLFAGCFL